jgi:hypothetical protein
MSNYGRQLPAAMSNYGRQLPAAMSNYGRQLPAAMSNYGSQLPAAMSNYGRQLPAAMSNLLLLSEELQAGCVYEHFTRHLNAHVTITASNCTNID